jgi:homospermidine synthase
MRCVKRFLLPAATGRAPHRGVVLRRQSRHGLLVRQAGIAQHRRRHGLKFKEPKTRQDWARLARKASIKGIHIAERDTQRAKQPKPMNVFVNTWSVEGFVSEGLQPAELGWGTHEKWLPANARRHKTGCGAAIYLLQPGANTRVRSWTPTAQAQYGFLVTHNESISIADYFTLRQGRKPHLPADLPLPPSRNDAVLSLHEVFGCAGAPQEDVHILDEHEIADGIDELGVLLYGHKKNAYWYRVAALDRRDPRSCAVPEQRACR